MVKMVWIKTVVALLLSVIVAVYVNQFLRSLKEETEVVVAARDIPPQASITSDMVKTVKANKADQKTLVPGALSNPNEVIGSLTVVSFKAGEVITDQAGKLVKHVTSGNGQTSLVSNGAAPSKSYLIPPDKRAITVRLDSEGALAFTLQKGDKVDVIVTSTGGDLGGVYSSIILQRIEVFDIETIAEKDKDKGASTTMQNVTLLVTSQEAQDLALAKRKGKIDLMLDPIDMSNGTSSAQNPTFSSKFTNPRAQR